MASNVVAMGRSAVTQSVHILASTHGRPYTVKPGLVLEPGASGTGDFVLLSADGKSVQYAAGDRLYSDEIYRFLTLTYSEDWKRQPWMKTVMSSKGDFVFKLAHTLSPWWGPPGSVSTWLHSFGMFYCKHRNQIDVAATQAALMLDGLFALRPLWTSLFNSLTVSMGEGGPEVFERWVKASDVAPLLGILIGSQGDRTISLEGLTRELAQLRDSPTPDFISCMSFSPYPMFMARAERAALELAPIITRLRCDLSGGKQNP